MGQAPRPCTTSTVEIVASRGTSKTAPPQSAGLPDLEAARQRRRRHQRRRPRRRGCGGATKAEPHRTRASAAARPVASSSVLCL